MKTNFDSDDQALVTGIVLGMMAKAGLPVSPVTDSEGDYMPMIRIDLDLGHVELTQVLLAVEA